MAAGMLCLLATASVAQQQVPIDRQYALVMKILLFEKNLNTRCGQPLRIGVVYQRDYRPSLVAARQWMDAASEGAAATIRGRQVESVLVEYTDARSLGQTLGARGICAVYVAPLRGVALRELAQETRDHGVLSLTGMPKYCSEGLAVGIGIADDKPQIIVNQSAAHQEGAEFSSQLLVMAKVLP
jgi:hypothetical protein